MGTRPARCDIRGNITVSSQRNLHLLVDCRSSYWTDCLQLVVLQIGEWGPMAASAGLALTEQVMAGVNAKSLAELRQVPALNLTEWPAAAYYGQQLFSGFFIEVKAFLIRPS